MLFNSLEYIVFLPVVFILYWFLNDRRLQNFFIVLVSYFFYGVWDIRFLLLIALTTFCSYLSGVLIEINGRTLKKLICSLNILINLGILFIFKYFNFFVDSISDIISFWGVEFNTFTLKLILPVGISFYTFQALSYTIDVYRGKIEPTKDVIAFFAFISFFPQLVAGPIERATNLLPQFLRDRKFDYPIAVDGLRQILWGFFKKMVVADNCAVAANIIFNNWQEYNGSTLLIGGILFSFQIYGDFSGYSDIARGTSKLFGIHIMKNFDYPYFSRNIVEFWKRWHISLNTWFVDYIYIPLGGSKEGKYKHIRNTFVIFILSGFWHGANWTYICWGLYHAILFIPLLLIGRKKSNGSIVAETHFLPNIKEMYQLALTFAFVLIGWIIFRSQDMSSALGYINKIFSTTLFQPVDHGTSSAVCFIYIAILLIIEWFHRKKEHGFEIQDWSKFSIVRCFFYYAIIIGILLVAGRSSSFVYFQF